MTEADILTIVEEEKVKNPYDIHEVLMNSYYRLATLLIGNLNESGDMRSKELLDRSIFVKSRLTQLAGLKPGSNFEIRNMTIALDVLTAFSLWTEIIEYLLGRYEELPEGVSKAWPKEKLMQLKDYPKRKHLNAQKELNATRHLTITFDDFYTMDQLFYYFQSLIMGQEKFAIYDSEFRKALVVLIKYQTSMTTPGNETIH